jgi:hypothetical protein
VRSIRVLSGSRSHEALWADTRFGGALSCQWPPPGLSGGTFDFLLHNITQTTSLRVSGFAEGESRRTQSQNFFLPHVARNRKIRRTSLRGLIADRSRFTGDQRSLHCMARAIAGSYLTRAGQAIETTIPTANPRHAQPKLARIAFRLT